MKSQHVYVRTSRCIDQSMQYVSTCRFLTSLCKTKGVTDNETAACICKYK